MYAEAFIFGLAIALAIGPIALLILNVSINHGWLAGLRCSAGAAGADFSFALVTFTAGSAVLALLEAWRGPIAVAAAVTLCLLGAWLLWQAWLARRRCCAPAASSGPGFLGTYLLTLANPLTILFFAAWMGSRQTTLSLADAVPLAAAVCAGSLLVAAALALGGHALRPILARPAALFGANVASGAGIVGFGLYRLLHL